jgi:AhpD family alkylhydroperoxidase
MSDSQTPMELLRQLAPEFAKNQMDAKALLFEHPNYQAVPAKYKILMGIAVAAAIGADTCVKMWSRQAIEHGATDQEIVEAILVARFMNQASVNDFTSETLADLVKARTSS